MPLHLPLLPFFPFSSKERKPEVNLGMEQDPNFIKEIKLNCRKMLGGDEEDSKWPPWLKPLLNSRFFAQCELHADSHKRECNMYCLDCMNGAICSLCRSHHRAHHVIQIRRSSYHDVIRVSEIQKYLDITGIQTYIINSARVVFLNERPQPRPGKGVTNTCEVCGRSLLTSFRFCSLGCKKERTSTSISTSFSNSKISTMSHRLLSDSEGSCTSHSHGKMFQSFSPSTPPPTANMSHRSAKRRKGVPHRAPLGSLPVLY
ncbi:PLATZ transcription factor family protein [Zostera marina]|uniref:PLATZ transcription factor family protein n=1 Tax=Zostera marina TaxID=29655 RepID=A0A0K9NYW7_ZOSMR|nr:PLATZ transcription factor family protein [Zostera marina]